MSKKFTPFCQKSRRATKTAFCVFRGTVWTEKILEKMSWVSFFPRTLSKKILAFHQISFDGIVKNVFYVSMWALRWKIFVKIYLRFQFIFGTWTEQTSVFRQVFWGSVEKTAFYVSIDVFWGERFKKEVFYVILDNSKNFPVLRTVFYMPRANFNVVFLKKMKMF